MGGERAGRPLWSGALQWPQGRDQAPELGPGLRSSRIHATFRGSLDDTGNAPKKSSLHKRALNKPLTRRNQSVKPCLLEYACVFGSFLVSSTIFSGVLDRLQWEEAIE